MTRTFSTVITAAALAPLLSVSAGAIHYGDGSAALLLGQTFSSVVCVLLLAFVLSWFARFIAIRQPLPQRFRGLQLIVSCLLFFPLAFTLVEGSVALAILAGAAAVLISTQVLKARDHLLLPRYKRRGSFQLNQRLTQAVNDRRAARANQVDARESAAAQLRGEQADPVQAAPGAAEPAASPVPVTARAAASLVEDASPAAAYPQEAAPVQDASAIPSPRQWSAGGAGHRRRGHTPDRAPTCAERSAAAAARSGNAEPAQLLTNPRAARSRGRTRKCPVCGKTVREGTRYCPGCDTPIHWDREL